MWRYIQCQTLWKQAHIENLGTMLTSQNVQLIRFQIFFVLPRHTTQKQEYAMHNAQMF